MSRPKVIGLHGKMGAGKDTVFDRLLAHWPAGFRRLSFAAPLKQSASAVIKVDIERIEILKRQDFPCIHITLEPPTKANPTPARVAMTMREFLQLYGTEGHRDIMGDDFWVDIAMAGLEGAQNTEGMLRIGPSTHVFTDCRFPNEAEAILARGGEVWRIIGPDDDTGSHSSEVPLYDQLISRVIDNTARGEITFHADDGSIDSIEPDFTALDAQLEAILSEWSRA